MYLLSQNAMVAWTKNPAEAGTVGDWEKIQLGKSYLLCSGQYRVDIPNLQPPFVTYENWTSGSQVVLYWHFTSLSEFL